MRIYRATYTDKNKILHTHVVMTVEQLIQVKRKARQADCVVFVETLNYRPAVVTTSKPA